MKEYRNMNKADEAVSLFKGGCCCSQAVLAAFGPSYSLSQEQCLKIACGFAGGMHLAETCGAVTGSFMVLGLRHAGADANTITGRAAAKAAVIEFTKRFEKRHGSVKCRDLLGCDISTPEGMNQAKQKGLIANVCPEVVRDAAEILEEMAP